LSERHQRALEALEHDQAARLTAEIDRASLELGGNQEFVLCWMPRPHPSWRYALRAVASPKSPAARAQGEDCHAALAT
jgi:hypothetical protein